MPNATTSRGSGRHRLVVAHVRRRSRRYLGALLALASLLAVSATVFAERPAQAIVGGDGAEDRYGVLIKMPAPYPKIDSPSYVLNAGTCTGSLIAERWVLTAAHCMRSTTEEWPSPTWSTRDITLHLGEAYAGQVTTTYHVDTMVVGRDRNVGTGEVVDDFALLHLTQPAPASLSPIPLVRSAAQLSANNEISINGWGPVQVGVPIGGQYFSTFGGWKLTSCKQGLNCNVYQPDSASVAYPAAGDSGGIVSNFDGNPQMQVGVFTGPYNNRVTGPTKGFGASILDNLPTILSVTGLPSPRANTIVRDESSGKSWLLDKTAVAHPIPNSAIYICLVRKRVPVQTLSHYNAMSIPWSYANATCP